MFVQSIGYRRVSKLILFIFILFCLSPRSYSYFIGLFNYGRVRILNLFAYFTLKYLISQLDAVAPTVTIYFSYRRTVTFLYILFTYRRGLT